MTPPGPVMHAPGLVRRTLLVNAIFSALSGAALVGLGGFLAPHFGLESAALLWLIGAGLLPFGALVGISAASSRPGRPRVLAIAVADLLWVGGSAVVLMVAWEALAPWGRALIGGVALVVGAFAYLQLYGARTAVRPRSSPGRSAPGPLSPGPLSPGRRIWRSWLSMKPWVKTWLFFLNGVFLAGLLFPAQPLTLWVLAAYLASGPLLAGIMIWQGGLTRLLGLAHLIPWTPLAVYLALRLTGDAVGPRVGLETHGNLYWWVLVLLATLAVCLVFDVYDVVRWIRGERFVLGTPEAARRGASRHTLADPGSVHREPAVKGPNLSGGRSPGS